MFDSLSLRGRFLVAPFLGVILTLVLYIASNAVMREHSELFQELSDHNLPQISEISRIITTQANNHSRLTTLLLSAVADPDEERVYLEGRGVLNKLHKIEDQLTNSISLSHNESIEYKEIYEKIHPAFARYRESTISAIELSTVDAKLAMIELLIAEKASIQLNDIFLLLSEYHIQSLSETSNLLENSLSDESEVTALAIGLILAMIFFALYFSRRMAADIKNTEQVLVSAREEAQRANLAKSEFLSRMSHELRTPMNAILGFGQLLKMDAEEFNQDHQENIQEILSAGGHLLHLIDEVLDLGKIESGKMEVTLDAVPVDKVIQECFTMIKAQAAARQLELIDQISNKKLSVQADSSRLKQVLLNLLSNAVKYNRDHGQITVDGEVFGKQRLRIRVTNTGPGLSDDEIAKLFVPFGRLNTTSSVEGTGIGLVIAKHIIEMMGGIIGVESVPGESATFWVELALATEA